MSVGQVLTSTTLIGTRQTLPPSDHFRVSSMLALFLINSCLLFFALAKDREKYDR